jgi:hypothetical protein
VLLSFRSAVMPAKARSAARWHPENFKETWMPAFAGMTADFLPRLGDSSSQKTLLRMTQLFYHFLITIKIKSPAIIGLDLQVVV